MSVSSCGDIFEHKGASPMLLSEQEEVPTGDFLYELKFDGFRCMAYVDSAGTFLQSRNNNNLIPSFPELQDMHLNVNGKCILDGELVVLSNGKPDFQTLRTRSVMKHPAKIKTAAKGYPACFVAFDILYKDGLELSRLPLTDRKHILAETLREGPDLAISRTFDQGEDLFRVVQMQELEGIVAKRKDSLYRYGKRTRDWIKVRNLIDEDFTALGYIEKDGSYTLILGKQEGTAMSYRGHVTHGVSRYVLQGIPTRPDCPYDDMPRGAEGAVWFDMPQECTVTYMERTETGGMRHSRLKSLGEVSREFV